MPNKPPTHDPRGRTPAQRLAERRASHDRRRFKEKPWRAWYSSPEWKALRRHTMQRDPACIMCLSIGVVQPTTHIDHIRAHEGEWSLFIDPMNTQGLCTTCHNSVKQKLELLQKKQSKE